MNDVHEADPPYHHSDRTHAAPARWAVLAAHAKPALAKLDHGHREEGFRILAEEADVSPQTLRRMVAMLNFVEKVETSQLLAQLNLRAAPLNGLEHVKKWYGYDPKGAAQAARELVRGAMVETIAAGEANARKLVSPRLRGRALAVEYRRLLSDHLDELLFVQGYKRVSVRRTPWYLPRVDCRFIRNGEDHISLVALAMGPYEQRSVYGKNLSDWMLRCMGLLTLYDRVVLSIPDRKIFDLSEEWLQENNASRNKLEIVYLECDP